MLDHDKTPLWNHTMTERVTDVTAVAAVTIAAWQPGLESVSGYAAAIMPVLGSIWLAVQIYAKLVDMYANRKKQKEEAAKRFAAWNKRNDPYDESAP